MFLRRNMKVHLFLTFLATTSAFSVSYVPQTRGSSAGRRLFGGYRIAPKICRATNPSKIKSTEPPICMFNHECKLQNGEVVGACMDGFLFGACCQLSVKRPVDAVSDEITSSIGNLENVYEVDHVPEIPILLNPDGTPMEMMPVPSSDKPSVAMDRVTPDNSSLSIKVNSTNTNVKASINATTSSTTHYADTTSNSEKVQFPQVDVSHLESDFPALLNQQSILDDLRLPGLLSHAESNNDINEQQDSSSVNPVTTFLNPDQVLQIADPVDQLPVLFSQAIGQNNYSGVDTILLNENGTVLDENNNPDELFLPGTYESSSTKAQEFTQPSSTFTTQGIEKVTQKIISLTQQMATATEKISAQTVSIMSEESTVTQQQSPSVTYELYSLPSSTVTPTAKPTETVAPTTYETDTPSELSTTPLDMDHSVAVNTEMFDKVTKYIPTLQSETTTPLSPSTSTEQEKLVKVPTISHEASSENKKHDVLNQEENSINHIISLLDDSNPSPGPEPFPQPEPNPHPDPNDENSGIQTWASVDGTTIRIPEIKVPVTRPTTTAATFPYTYYKPAQGSIYYDYEVTNTEAPILVNTHGVPLNTYSAMTSDQGSYLTSPSTQNIYSNRPSSNPPAPTVIVLGPLGTEYTTKISQNTPVRRPVSSTTNANITKNPSFSTTVTHNVNTVISTNNAFANQTKIVSTSYISVDLKDGTTSTKPVTVSEVMPVVSENVGSVTTEEIGTAEPVATIYEEIRTKRPPTTAPTPSPTWPSKPTFYLKPYTSRPSTEGTSASWLHPTTTILLNNDPVIATTTILEEETLAPADLSNFPPVRNPNLNMSIPGSQQEKPTILETYNHTYYPDLQVIDEDDIPTPAFIEDDVLKNKVDGFVNKIVSSLQDNFDDLKDVVYKKKTTITTTTSTTTRPSATKRPATVGTGSTTRKPTRKPPTSTSQTTTRTPTSTKRPPLRTSSTTPKTVSSSVKPSRPVKVSSPKPRPTLQTTSSTKAPQTITKRPKPPKKPTTTATTAAYIADDSEVTPFSSTHIPTTSHIPDFRTECGVRPLIKTGRIVGGKGAKFGEWPWQVLVREATWLGLFTKNKCGGVLITNKYVITAAHCQPGFLASLVAVFGEFDISGDLEPKRSVSRNVRRVIVHRNYNAATFENDLALLELETPVQFDAHIVPICMPDDHADFTGRMATVTGWGRLKYNGGVPSVLQEVQVPIIENAVCQEMFQTTSHSKLILDSFLCAGYANGQKDSCEGDSGGPLMLERPDGRWELVGTVSHGIKCAAPYLPGVYMRTTYFKPWLHSVTGV